MNTQILLSGITPLELKDLIIKGVKEELSKTLFKPEPAKKEDSSLLSVKEACEFLKCSTTKLWRFRKSKKLQAKKCGRNILFVKKDLENLLSNGTNRQEESLDS
ncbi:helix-turn-helix domain-containing protein [Gaetbulibacter sp. M240]|uniref:helix-turn-helix domain-containing protein n=1 Tax=Gaetbulibacter sp. M240 TaxID=3126511 RepID=UPI00374F99B8